jgi:hypothetical protein
MSLCEKRSTFLPQTLFDKTNPGSVYVSNRGIMAQENNV